MNPKFTNHTSSDFERITQNFRALIIKQCKFCRFDKFVEEHPEFQFPEVAPDMLDSDEKFFISIPGLMGGFAYYLTTMNDEPVLYAEQSSRMDYSSEDYDYFAITAKSSQLLKGVLRDQVKRRFWELFFEPNHKA